MKESVHACCSCIKVAPPLGHLFRRIWLQVGLDVLCFLRLNKVKCGLLDLACPFIFFYLDGDARV